MSTKPFDVVPASESAASESGNSGRRSSSERNSFLDLTSNETSALASPSRTHLVKRSQKLTQLFGQPPPASINSIYHRRHSISLTSLAIDERSFVDFDDPPLYTPSAASIYESMSPEERVDADRSRMRLKLSRLHRFLGSHVPVELVTGVDPDSFPNTQPSPPESPTQSRPPFWVKRRRSSSAAAIPVSWSEPRLKDDMTDEEKARNVKRAIKLEQKFGVAPPQALYHPATTPSSSPSHTPKAKPSTNTRPPQLDPSGLPITRNRNQSAYRKGSSSKAHTRPGSSESSRPLLSGIAYDHFNQSLYSLGDMIDRDDKESLAELHHYLSEDESFTQDLTGSQSPSLSSPISDRRRSLPPRASMISSVGSDTSSLYAASPEISPFELRRRKASKLIQFFGVDYTLLIHSVLESIEKGVQAESSAGHLDASQTEALMQKVRDLRVRGQSLSSTITN